MLGYHDSEMSIVLEDTVKISSTMDGHSYEASKFAATLRRRLWREHLGLLPAQPLDATDDPAAQPPAEELDDVEGESKAATKGDARDDMDREEEFVSDPLDDKLWARWTTNATVNTEVFRSIFHADPDDYGMLYPLPSLTSSSKHSLDFIT